MLNTPYIKISEHMGKQHTRTSCVGRVLGLPMNMDTPQAGGHDNGHKAQSPGAEWQRRPSAPAYLTPEGSTADVSYALHCLLQASLAGTDPAACTITSVHKMLRCIQFRTLATTTACTVAATLLRVLPNDLANIPHLLFCQWLCPARHLQVLDHMLLVGGAIQWH